MPVLSSTTVSTLLSIDNASGLRMTIPRRAPFEVATARLIGTAMPSAQGQAITRTAIAAETESSRVEPMANQAAKVSRAMTITAGTKIDDTLSVSEVIFVFVAVASRTRSAIRAIRLLELTAVVSISKVLLKFSAPAATATPSRTTSGTDSPVSRELSIEPEPSLTMPSTGTRSPIATTTRSPLETRAVETVSWFPLRRTTAVSGIALNRARTESVAERRVFTSSHRPIKTTVGTTAATSK